MRLRMVSVSTPRISARPSATNSWYRPAMAALSAPVSSLPLAAFCSPDLALVSSAARMSLGEMTTL